MPSQLLTFVTPKRWISERPDCWLFSRTSNCWKAETIVTDSPWWRGWLVYGLICFCWPGFGRGGRSQHCSSRSMTRPMSEWGICFQLVLLDFEEKKATKPASFDCISSSTLAKDSEARRPEDDGLTCEGVLGKLTVMIASVACAFRWWRTAKFNFHSTFKLISSWRVNVTLYHRVCQ